MKHYLLILAALFLCACEDIIGVEDISEETVVTLAPANEAVLTQDSVVFSWDTMEDAEAYRIQVARPAFENATQIVLDSLVTSSSFSQVLESGEYHWRVRAENSGYTSRYTTNSFTINGVSEDISSAQVQLLAPAEGLVFTTSETITFSWESVQGANSYTLQVASPNFESASLIVEDTNQTQTTFSIDNLDANSYEWRVRAENSEYQTLFSTQSFTVED